MSKIGKKVRKAWGRLKKLFTKPLKASGRTYLEDVVTWNVIVYKSNGLISDHLGVDLTASGSPSVSPVASGIAGFFGEPAVVTSAASIPTITANGVITGEPVSISFIPDITVGVGQDYDMSQYISDPQGLVRSSVMTGLSFYASYDDTPASETLTGLVPATLTGVELEVTYGLSASGVTGVIEADEQVTIAYDGVNGFGATGPTIRLFEDFRNYTADAAMTNNPVVGTYAAVDAGTATAIARNDNPHSGSLAAEWCTSVNSADANINFDACTEVFFSLWFRIPPGTTWPGTLSTETYPATSAWKVTWFTYHQYPNHTSSTGAEGAADLTLPTYFSQSFAYGGNDSNTAGGMFGTGWYGPPDPDQFHTFGEWARITGWIRKEDGVNDTAHAQHIGPLAHTTATSTTRSIFGTELNPGEDSLSHVVLSWISDTNDANCRIQYDDIYLATGPGSAARVEIGEDATYANCKELAICTVDSWSDTSVTVTLREGGHASYLNKYIHIHDADNNYVGSSRLIS